MLAMLLFMRECVSIADEEIMEKLGKLLIFMVSSFK